MALIRPKRLEIKRINGGLTRIPDPLRHFLTISSALSLIRIPMTFKPAGLTRISAD